MPRRYYGLTYLTALVAALFLALGPAIAPVLSASPKTRTIEICTSFGLLQIAVDGDYAAGGAEKSPENQHAKSSHCVFCNLRQAALLPQGAALAVPYFIPLTYTKHNEYTATPAPVLTAYQSRAPPVLLT